MKIASVHAKALPTDSSQTKFRSNLAFSRTENAGELTITAKRSYPGLMERKSFGLEIGGSL